MHASFSEMKYGKIRPNLEKYKTAPSCMYRQNAQTSQ